MEVKIFTSRSKNRYIKGVINWITYKGKYMKYKIHDIIKTSQDWHEAYEGEIVKIARYPHPYSTEPEPKKNMTWYTITTPRKNHTFTTNDIKDIQL